MGLTDWTSVDPKPANKGSNKDIYLRLEAGKKYRVRPVGPPKEIHRYYVQGPDGKFRSAITADPRNCIIRQKYPNEQPKLRYAVNVIDRADGKIKILEAAPSVFRPMKEWAEQTGRDPGGSEGVDFSINVECPGGDKRRTTYTATPLVQQPFTSDELALIRSSGHKLSEIYQPTDQAKIESILFGAAPAGKTASAAPASSVSNPAPAQSVAAAEDDFGF